MIPSIGFTEIIVIAVIAIVLFGKRLPEVARNVGKHYGELRKGLSEIQSSINAEADENERRSERASDDNTPEFDDYQEPTAPKMEPPKVEDTA